MKASPHSCFIASLMSKIRALRYVEFIKERMPGDRVLNSITYRLKPPVAFIGTRGAVFQKNTSFSALDFTDSPGKLDSFYVEIGFIRKG